MDCENFLVEMTKKEGWKKKSIDDVKKAKVVCLYFAAAWAPPCRGFTPILKKFYNQCNESGYNLEIIYCGLDEDSSEFKTFFDTMPWVALPFDYARTDKAKEWGINQIPALVVANRLHNCPANPNARLDMFQNMDKGKTAAEVCEGWAAQELENQEKVALETETNK